MSRVKRERDWGPQQRRRRRRRHHRRSLLPRVSRHGVRRSSLAMKAQILASPRLALPRFSFPRLFAPQGWQQPGRSERVPNNATALTAVRDGFDVTRRNACLGLGNHKASTQVAVHWAVRRFCLNFLPPEAARLSASLPCLACCRGNPSPAALPSSTTSLRQSRPSRLPAAATREARSLPLSRWSTRAAARGKKRADGRRPVSPTRQKKRSPNRPPAMRRPAR